ncbi:MAG: ABC transporter ATP-binding protein [Thermotogota bacterium]
MATLSILKIDEVTAGYGKAVVLENMSLEVKDGECHAVLGPNGAGKSTLLKTITGTVVPTAGEIKFLGESIKGMDTYKIARKGISLSPENRRLFPDLTVNENLTIATIFSDESRKEENLNFVYEIFPRLKERFSQKAGTMSGGEQQMLAIGRALMMDPKILLLDEPSMGLAQIIKEQIFNGIKKIRETGKTILLVEQDATMVMPIADKISIFEHGRIIFEGSSDELKNNDSIKSAYLGL